MSNSAINSKVLSPLTGKEARYIRSIDTEQLIGAYKKSFEINVKHIFNDLKSISIYECNDSGFRFFHPENIAGNGEFYESLQTNSWYYMPWKWEHENASKHITLNDKVLEVGCAEGEFLYRNVAKKKITARGLELNTKAIQSARDKKIDVFNQTIESFADENENAFDMTCSFQVVEHISDVKGFIQAQIKTLKKGGLLIISVPNNAGFLGADAENVLNLPPHHMGLWNEKSLKFLTTIFPIKLKSFYYEPLQEYHHNYFWKVMAKQAARSNFLPKPISSRLINNPKIQKMLLPFLSKKFKAFTIQAVYSKL